MAEPASELTGPDLQNGIRIDDIADGSMLQGHAFGEAVLLARRGDEFFAIAATCTHYGGPLSEGLLTGETTGLRRVFLSILPVTKICPARFSTFQQMTS